MLTRIHHYYASKSVNSLNLRVKRNQILKFRRFELSLSVPTQMQVCPTLNKWREILTLSSCSTSRLPLPRWETPIDETVAVYKGRKARWKNNYAQRDIQALNLSTWKPPTELMLQIVSLFFKHLIIDHLDSFHFNHFITDSDHHVISDTKSLLFWEKKNFP